MSISPKTPTSTNTIFGFKTGNKSTETHLNDLQKTYTQPNNPGSHEEKSSALKKGLEDILSLKTNGSSKTQKDRTNAETKLHEAISKLKESPFKTEALRLFEEIRDTSTNSSSPGDAIPSSSYAYNITQLAALNIGDLKRSPTEAAAIKPADASEEGIAFKKTDSDLTQNEVDNGLDLKDLENLASEADMSTINDPDAAPLEAAVADLVPEFQLEKTPEKMAANIALIDDFMENLEDSHPETMPSDTQIISSFLSHVDQQIAQDPSRTPQLTATKEAFRDAFIEKYGLLVPNKSAIPSLSKAPSGTSIMTDKKTDFTSKLEYLADTGSGLAMLHAFGGSHGNFSMENTVLHNGHGLLTDFSLDTPSAETATLGGKYPAPEAIFERETGRTDKVTLQKLDVFAFGIEVLHATVDKTIPNIQGVIDNSSHKFPESGSRTDVGRFLKQTRRLEEGLTLSVEKHPIRKELATLIHDCTRANPRDRISMDDAVIRLRQLIQNNPERPSILP